MQPPAHEVPFTNGHDVPIMQKINTQQHWHTESKTSPPTSTYKVRKVFFSSLKSQVGSLVPSRVCLLTAIFLPFSVTWGGGAGVRGGISFRLSQGRNVTR